MSDIENAPEETGGEEQVIDSILGKLGDFDDEGAAAENQEQVSASAEAEGDEADASEAEKQQTKEESDKADPAEPVIEPPDSWTAEARERFKQLPRDLQAVIADREAEQKRAFNRQVNEASEAKKAAEAERQRYAQQLDFYIQSATSFDPILAEGQKTDWAKLAQDDPALYVQKWAVYQQRVGQVQAAMAERQKIAEQTARETLTKEQSALADKLPEWKDETKRKALAADVTAALTSHYGFAKEELSALVDHRTFLVALDAARYRKLMAERKALPEKKVVTVPKVQKPGSGGENLSGAERVKAMKQRAAKTDNLHERAALIAAALD